MTIYTVYFTPSLSRLSQVKQDANAEYFNIIMKTITEIQMACVLAS